MRWIKQISKKTRKERSHGTEQNRTANKICSFVFLLHRPNPHLTLLRSTTVFVIQLTNHGIKISVRVFAYLSTMALVARPARTWLILTLFTVLHRLASLSSPTPTTACKFTFLDRNKLYNYTLSSPIRNFPHGILSEDGCTLFPSLYTSWSVLIYCSFVLPCYLSDFTIFTFILVIFFG